MPDAGLEWNGIGIPQKSGISRPKKIEWKSVFIPGNPRHVRIGTPESRFRYSLRRFVARYSEQTPRILTESSEHFSGTRLAPRGNEFERSAMSFESPRSTATL